MRLSLRSAGAGAALLCALLPTAAGARAPLQSLFGTWRGSLNGAVPLVLHMKSSADGSPRATLDSPTQGAMGLEFTEFGFDGDTLKLKLGAVAAGYRAVLSADRSRLEGTWTQGGGNFPLEFSRSADSGQARRPQDPQPPLPYEAREVTVPNAAAQVSLAGTLTVPPGKGPFPAALLVSGSGPPDRDEAVFGHSPFLVWADFLTRAGFAVLRLDDRGVGKSTGSFAAATTEDFASDAHAAVAWLRAQPGVDAGRIGILGHSEGGLIAPMVAATDPKLAWIVLLAGPALRGDSLQILQGERLREWSGAPREVGEREGRVQRRLFDLLHAEPDSGKFHAGATKVLNAYLDSLPPQLQAQLGDRVAFVDGQVRTLNSPWMRWFQAHEPLPVIRRVHCPVRATYGTRDFQVPAPENSAPMQEALRKAGNTASRVMVLDGLNHLLQPAVTGTSAEYGMIEETVAPAAMDAVGAWLKGR